MWLVANWYHFTFIGSGALGELGSSLFNFNHKGIVRVPQKELQSSNTDSDELAIEVGAEEVILEEDECAEQDSTKPGGEDEEKCYQFICAPKDLSVVAGAIKGRSFTILSAALDYTPKTLVKLSQDEYEKAEHLIGLLEAHEEVIDIYDNFMLEDHEQ